MSGTDSLSLNDAPLTLDPGKTAPFAEKTEAQAASPLAEALAASGSDGERPRMHPKWSKAAETLGERTESAGKRFTGPAADGVWVWLPQGPGPKVPWSKRHPVLFWGGIIVLLGLAFAWGRVHGTSSFTGPKIAVINIEGMILDSGPTVAWMEKIRKDPGYKGAVVRINSPGGAVGPSQELYAGIKRLAASKPVAASMGALAASGGYYVALGADELFAGPSTLTASIGVKMQLPNIEGLMRTIGVSEKTLSTGRLKDAGNAWREMSPEEEAYFRSILNDMFDEFVGTVAKERKMPLTEVRKLADGRAMTGRQALEAGLVDTLGDFHAALESVRERSNLAPGEAVLEEGPEKPASMLTDLLKSVLETAIGHSASVEQPLFMY